MGWGDRIARPTQDRRVHISDVSKEQLAAALNEQSERFKVIRQQLEEATRMLCAIILEPESFQYADGRRTVATAALQKVKNGMTLHMNTRGDVVELTVDRPGAPDIELQRIIIPAGVR